MITYIRRAALAFTLLSLPLSPLSAETTDMATKPEFGYTIHATADNMVTRLYVNGAPLIFHGRLSSLQFTFPIEQYLRDGENTITLDYEPLNAETQSYEPHAGVALGIELDQNIQGASMGEIDIFHGQYNVEAKTLVAADTHRFTGAPLRPQAGLMHAPARYNLAPVDMNYSKRSSGEHARRLTLPFEIKDPTLGALPQDGRAVLEDTPEMRKALHAAYDNLHKVIAARNVEAYAKIMKPVLDRTAYVNGYDDTMKLLKDIFELSPFGGPAGSTLRAMPSEQEVQSGALIWGADKRLVSVFNSPISFVDDAGAVVGVYAVMFCRSEEGEFEVCFQQDIPY